LLISIYSIFHYFFSLRNATLSGDQRKTKWPSSWLFWFFFFYIKKLQTTHLFACEKVWISKKEAIAKKKPHFRAAWSFGGCNWPKIRPKSAIPSTITVDFKNTGFIWFHQTAVVAFFLLILPKCNNIFRTMLCFQASNKQIHKKHQVTFTFLLHFVTQFLTLPFFPLCPCSENKKKTLTKCEYLNCFFLPQDVRTTCHTVASIKFLFVNIVSSCNKNQ